MLLLRAQATNTVAASSGFPLLSLAAAADHLS
jgi:hypothetical protein